MNAEQSLAPEDAFALLGNDTRIAVLRALAESPDGTATFSDLRHRVGERDSGKFNYHLRKLDGHFVRRTDGGYELTLAGQQVVGALLAGTYTTDVAVDPIEVEDPCPACGGQPLVIEYADEQVLVRCQSCEDWYNQFAFPPGTLEQFDRAELPGAIDRWMWAVLGGVVAGFCANCDGRVDGRLVADAERREGLRADWRCDRCGEHVRANALTPVLYHPEVRGFLHERGVDPASTPSWRLGAALSHEVEIAAEDPLSLTVALTLDGDTVHARLGPDLAVTDVTRGDL